MVYQESLFHQENDIGEEEEETLSLSELLIYNDNFISEESSYEEEEEEEEEAQPSDQPFFEFFSEEWSSNSISTPPPDSFIFCGKMIASKEPISKNTQNPKTNHKTGSKKLKSLFRWNSNNSLYEHPTRASKSKSDAKRSKSFPGHLARNNNGGDKNGANFSKGVTFLASPSKSRWYFFLFGLARFDPRKMELVDIKSRQLRQNQTTLCREEDGDTVVTGGGKGLWGLIEALSCGVGHHANGMVWLGSSGLTR